MVTGSSRGIGLAIAAAAWARGARVGLIARSADDLEHAAARLGGPIEGKIATAAADVSSRADLEGALTDIESRIGPIGVLVNNAGIGAYGPFGESDLDSLEHALSVNYLGTVYGTRAVLPAMVERHGGHIVNIASVAGRIATPGESAYSASKFAVVGFTQCIAMELRGSGVGVTMVLPGPVDLTGFVPQDETYKRSFPPKVPAQRVARATLRGGAPAARSGCAPMVPRSSDPPGHVLGSRLQAAGRAVRARGCAGLSRRAGWGGDDVTSPLGCRYQRTNVSGWRTTWQSS